MADASAACITSARALADECAGEPVLAVGLPETVGNNPDGSLGETPVPEIPGRYVAGGKLAEEFGIGVLVATTTSEAVPLKDRAPEAVASAEMRMCEPTRAVDRTRISASSSAARSTGKVPIAHVVRSGWGHTGNVGAPARPPRMPARTDTGRLAALVDHTQITKVASWPAWTSPPPESGWTRTHSCGVARLCFLGLGEWLGFGLGELDVLVGDGEGELDVLVGVGEGELVFGLGDPEEVE